MLAADQRRQAPRPCRASKRPSAPRSPRTRQAGRGPAKPLQRLRPEVGVARTDRRAGAGCPRAITTVPGVGQRLQAGGEVGRLADHRLLLRRSPSPIRSPTTTRPVAIPTRAASGWPAGRRESGHRLDDREPGAHRPLGVVLMRLRPAEIGQHAVAHELGDVALEARDPPAQRVLVGAHDVAHVLGVEAAESAVEPTRSTNITVSWRRSASRGAGPAMAGTGAAAGAAPRRARPDRLQQAACGRRAARRASRGRPRRAPGRTSQSIVVVAEDGARNAPDRAAAARRRRPTRSLRTVTTRRTDTTSKREGQPERVDRAATGNLPMSWRLAPPATESCRWSPSRPISSAP